MQQRGANAVRATPKRTKDWRWGNIDPEEWAGRVKLMTHPAYGERYFKDEDVANRESRGWIVVEYSDPTVPTKRTPGRPRKE